MEYGMNNDVTMDGLTDDTEFLRLLPLFHVYRHAQVLPTCPFPCKISA